MTRRLFISADSNSEAVLKRVPRHTTCAAFWQAADRLELTDAEALDLIGYAGKIGAAGKRPRFQLTPHEVLLAAYLPLIGAALRSGGQVPAWLKRPNRLPPFYGRTPIEFMVERPGEGEAEVLKFLRVLSRSFR